MREKRMAMMENSQLKLYEERLMAAIKAREDILGLLSESAKKFKQD